VRIKLDSAVTCGSLGAAYLELGRWDEAIESLQ